MDRASARRSSVKGRERAIKAERGPSRTGEGHQGRERAIKDERGPSSIRRTVEPLQMRHWGNFPERQGGVHMGFSERIGTILN